MKRGSEHEIAEEILERLVAEHRFAQLHELSTKLLDFEKQLDSSDPKLRNKLVSLSIEYLEGLGREALRDKQLALEIGSAYLVAARIQGVPEWNHQGQYAAAQKSLSKVEIFADSVLHQEPRNREALWLSANAAHDRAVTAYAERSSEQVLLYSPKAVEGFARLAQLGNMTRREINGATYIYGDLAEVHIGLHRFGDAVRYARLGIEFSRDTPSIPGPRAQAFNMLAGALMGMGDYQGALEAIQEARKQLEQLRHEDPNPWYIGLIQYQTRCREALILGEDGSVNLDRPLEATVLLQQALDTLEPFAQNDANNYEARSTIAIGGHYLGNILRHSNPKRALAIYDNSLIRIREVPNDVAARRVEALLLAGSSYATRWTHHEDDARARIDAAFRLLRETKDYPAEAIMPGSEADSALNALADDYAETGQSTKAVDCYHELRRQIMASNPDPQNDLVNAARISRLDYSLAALLRRVGRAQEAAALEEDRLKLWRDWGRKLPNNPFVLRQTAGQRRLRTDFPKWLAEKPSPRANFRSIRLR